MNYICCDIKLMNFTDFLEESTLMDVLVLKCIFHLVQLGGLALKPNMG